MFPSEWPTSDSRRAPRKKNPKHEGEYAFGAFVTTFFSVLFFTLAIGILIPINSNVCYVDEDGNCNGCNTCGADNKRYGVEPGMYREYTPENVLVMAFAAGVVRFIASMLQGRWATSSMDWTTDIALAISNWLKGDHKFYWKVFLGQSAAYILAPLVSVGTLYLINDGPRDLGFATSTIRGSGSAGGNARSIFSVLFIAIFGTFMFLWSRVSYVDGSVPKKHKADMQQAVDSHEFMGIRVPMYYFVSVWPEITRHYATAFFHGASTFTQTLVTCYYIGPYPLQLWHIIWVTGASVIAGEGAIPDGFPDTVVSRGWRFGLFTLGAFARLLIPFLLVGYVWSQGIANSYKIGSNKEDK